MRNPFSGSTAVEEDEAGAAEVANGLRAGEMLLRTGGDNATSLTGDPDSDVAGDELQGDDVAGDEGSAVSTVIVWVPRR